MHLSNETLWQRFQAIQANQRIPQALLLIAPAYTTTIDFIYKIASAILCLQVPQPCSTCKSCRLVQQREHPDLYHLEPDKVGGVIKVDQIRSLHDLAYTSPQLATHRVIVINPAEKMNISAANALLKLLEEPPETVNFLLVAEQISTLPATIISRCQQWRFFSEPHLAQDYLSLLANSPAETSRAMLFTQLPIIIDEFTAFLEHKLSVCTLVSKWLAYDLNELLGLLYLINAQLIDYQLNGPQRETSWAASLYLLSQRFHPVHLYSQLDRINAITKKLQQNISVNHNLVLENLLLGYTCDHSKC